MQVQLALVLTLALAGGLLGWRRTRRRWRSLYDEKPIGMSDSSYQRLQRRQHLFRRITQTIVATLIGGGIGWILSLLLHRPPGAA